MIASSLDGRSGLHRCYKFLLLGFLLASSQGCNGDTNGAQKPGTTITSTSVASTASSISTTSSVSTGPPPSVLPDARPGNCNPSKAAPGEASTVVLVYFTCVDGSAQDEVKPTERLAPASEPLAGALRALLRGPSREERERGFFSLFSEANGNGDNLLSATIDGNTGLAIVNFADLSREVANATTTTGSGMLLRELQATIFQFSSVKVIRYEMDGSCEKFWDWLESQCHNVERPAR